MTTKERVIKIGKMLLMIWGGISLLGVIVFAIYFFDFFNNISEPVTDNATKDDVRFVLNWCGLGDERIEKVMHSYVSSTSLQGDHYDAYEIKITHVSLDELSKADPFEMRNWYRGDSLPEIIDDAVAFACTNSHETPWFPSTEKLKTTDFYIYSWSISCHGVRPDFAQLIFLNPATKTVYYVSTSI